MLGQDQAAWTSCRPFSARLQGLRWFVVHPCTVKGEYHIRRRLRPILSMSWPAPTTTFFRATSYNSSVVPDGGASQNYIHAAFMSIVSRWPMHGASGCTMTPQRWARRSRPMSGLRQDVPVSAHLETQSHFQWFVAGTSGAQYTPKGRQKLEIDMAGMEICAQLSPSRPTSSPSSETQWPPSERGACSTPKRDKPLQRSLSLLFSPRRPRFFFPVSHPSLLPFLSFSPLSPANTADNPTLLHRTPFSSPLRT